MKLMSVVAVGAAVTAAAWAGDGAQAEQPTVTVCMSRRGNPTAFRAEAIATQVFARIGVRIDWPADQDSCILSPDSIAITLSDQTPPGLYPGVLAYAAPYQGTRIVVFYDRVLNTVTRSQQSLLLGYVLAHEISHLLQGISRHSASGIMKRKWEARDYVEMRWNALRFTEYDVSLIRDGLYERRLQVSRHASTGAIAAQ